MGDISTVFLTTAFTSPKHSPTSWSPGSQKFFQQVVVATNFADGAEGWAAAEDFIGWRYQEKWQIEMAEMEMMLTSLHDIENDWNGRNMAEMT